MESNSYELQHNILDSFVRGSQAGFTEHALHTYYDDHNGDIEAGYRGRHFDTWGGHRGDAEQVKNTIDHNDVFALTALSIERGINKIYLGTQTKAAELTSLLAEIPTDMPIYSPEAERHVAPTSAANALWNVLRSTGGKRLRVAAYKMTARKRPELLPVYDNITEEVLSYPDSIWQCMYTYFQRDPSRLEDIRNRRTAANIKQQPTELRCLDVALWMKGAKRY